MKQKIINALNDYKAIIAVIMTIIGLLFVWDKTYVRAEVEVKNNAELQQSIKLVNKKLSMEIAKLQLDNARDQYNEFVLEYGTDINKMSDVNKMKYLNLQNKLEEAQKKYDNLFK